jgi:hypothetical protein
MGILRLALDNFRSFPPGLTLIPDCGSGERFLDSRDVSQTTGITTGF